MSLPADFRCSAAARERADDLAGTASTVRTFLLVENSGPWGRDALLDSRLPEGLGRELKAAAGRAGVRALLIRRGGRSGTDEGIRVFAAHATPGHTWLATTHLASYHQLLRLDLASLGRGERPEGWQATAGPLFATCTHGKHDACCAERGRPAALTVREAAGEAAWEVSHIGGDRFAGNMVVLPWGLYYGGLDEQNAAGVVAAHRRDRVDLALLRGRSSYPMPVQYADIALRRHLDATGIGAVTVRSAERDGTLTRTVLTHDGADWAVDVRTEPRGHARLTCTAQRDNPLPVHEVVRLEQVRG